MGNENGTRSNLSDRLHPVLAAVHHDAATFGGDQKRAVPPMVAAARFGVSASTEKSELHVMFEFHGGPPFVAKQSGGAAKQSCGIPGLTAL
jgi:hypothetical protein